MLSSPLSAIKSFNDDLSSVIGTIHLLAKLDNDEEGYIHKEETFFIIEAKYM